MRPWKALLGGLLTALLLAAGTASAQGVEGETVEGRLLEILRQRGIVTEAEFGELSRLEQDLRSESRFDAQLDARISEMVASMAKTDANVTYKRGSGFVFTTADDKFQLQLGGRIQSRFTAEFPSGGGNKYNFSIPRARVWLKGHAFEPWWKYKLQFDVAGDEADTKVSFASPPAAAPLSGTFSSTNRLAELKDAYGEFAKWKAFSVRFGQYKVPYSRQQLVSSGSQEFVERSIVDKAFVPGRDIGLMVFGTAGGEKQDLFEYYAGMFNGEGENKKNNDRGFMWAGRVAINPFGGVKYSEVDFADSDFRMQAGLNAWYHDNDGGTGSNAMDQYSFGGDLTAIWHGIYATGELHHRKNRMPAPTPNATLTGWFAQAGYMVVPGTLDVGLRWARVNYANDPSGRNYMREILGVLGYYFDDHNLKLQADVGKVETGMVAGTKSSEWRLQVQFQIIF